MASFPSNLAVQTQSHDRVTFQSRVNGVRSPNLRPSLLHPFFPIHLHPSTFVTILRFLLYIRSSGTLHFSSHHSYVYRYTLRLLRVSTFTSLSFSVPSPFSLSYANTFHVLFSFTLSFFVFLPLCRLFVSLLFSSSAPRVKPLRLALEVISISF